MPWRRVRVLTHNQHPDLVEKIAKIMAGSHTPSALFPIKALDKTEK